MQSGFSFLEVCIALGLLTTFSILFIQHQAALFQERNQIAQHYLQLLSDNNDAEANPT